jgi:hypothetical protein
MMSNALAQFQIYQITGTLHRVKSRDLGVHPLSFAPVVDSPDTFPGES